MSEVHNQPQSNQRGTAVAPIPMLEEPPLCRASARWLNALVMPFWIEAATTSPAGDSFAVARYCVHRGRKCAQAVP